MKVMMDKETLKQTFDLLPLVERDTLIKRVGIYYMGPCPFCGGRDRFTLKNTAQGWRWYCRGCAAEMWNDAIAYVMNREQLDFVGAVTRMGGELNGFTEKAALRPPAIDLPQADWQDQARKMTHRACVDLMQSKGRRARAYLTARGFSQASWYCHLLGYAEPWGLSAIVIPHFDNADHVTAIKYRMMDTGKGARYRAMKGSTLLFWGLHTVYDHHKTLVLVEGELNGISIAQVCALGLSVLSFGGENLTGAQQALIALVAGKYQRVIVWADKAEKARAVQAPVGKPCVMIQSPYGQDANDLLQAGVLAEFLARVGGAEKKPRVN
jgi:DNA primase